MNFNDLAKQATTLSDLMNGRNKVSKDDLMRNYPDGVTVVGFDFVNGTKGDYPICIIAEDDKIFFNGGCVVDKIVRKWVEAYAGDIKGCSDALKANGGVKMKFAKGTTKGGNSITTVEII